MDDLLLAYLMHSLDPAERQHVEQQLAASAALRERLHRLKAVLAPLAEDAGDPEPPPDLALSTLAYVAEQECQHRLPKTICLTRGGSAPLPSYWTRADVLVAACIALVCLSLLAPLVSGMWKKSDRHACANNLRKLWNAMALYADAHEGNFPRVEESGPFAFAGVYVPHLAEAGFLDSISTDCPARGNRPASTWSLGDLERLYHQAPEEHYQVIQFIGGHYAYTLGYDDGNGLRHARLDSGENLPIMADRPGPNATNSENHAGRGQNILAVGGHVRWATRPQAGLAGDHIYLNHHFRHEAGIMRTDTVLGASGSRPYPD